MTTERPQPSAVPPALIARLKHAIEGECEGLAVDDAHAAAILAYVLAGRPPVAARAAAPAEGMQPVALLRLEVESILDRLESLRQSTPLDASSIWDDKYAAAVAQVNRCIEQIDALAATPQAHAPELRAWLDRNADSDGKAGREGQAYAEKRSEYERLTAAARDSPDPELPPWLLPLEVAQRIGNEYRVRVGLIQAIARAVAAASASRAYTYDEIIRYGRICFWHARATTGNLEPMPAVDLIDVPAALSDALAAAAPVDAPRGPDDMTSDALPDKVARALRLAIRQLEAHRPVDSPSAAKAAKTLRAHLASTQQAEALRKALRQALQAFLTWGESQCPCRDEKPDPCPLCGASVAEGTCKAAESKFPRTILEGARAALTRPTAGPTC